jgi:hypothetical protein
MSLPSVSEHAKVVWLSIGSGGFELVGFAIALGYLQAFAGAIGAECVAAVRGVLRWLRRGWRAVVRKLEGPPITTPANMQFGSPGGVSFGAALDLRTGDLAGRVTGLERDLAKLRDEILPAKILQAEAILGGRIGVVQRDLEALHRVLETSQRRERRHNVVATVFFTVGLVLAVLANIAGAP